VPSAARADPAAGPALLALALSPRAAAVSLPTTFLTTAAQRDSLEAFAGDQTHRAAQSYALENISPEHRPPKVRRLRALRGSHPFEQEPASS
jgi:hypothetical protein